MSEASPVPETETRKRNLGDDEPCSSDTPGSARGNPNPRKAHKVSRACDSCKLKKARCSGTIPCNRCVQRGLVCFYDARYSRGRPPTPPSARPQHAQPTCHEGEASLLESSIIATSTHSKTVTTNATAVTTERNSPELDAAEIEGQYFDPTSGLTFLHRAYRRLAQKGRVSPHVLGGPEHTQPLMTAGDRPLLIQDADRTGTMSLPPDAKDLIDLYFDVCVVTYRIFHRQTVLSWLHVAEQNRELGLPIVHGIGHAKAATLFAIVAVTMLKVETMQKRSEPPEDTVAEKADQYFSFAAALTDTEAGLPQLESAQARLIQVLYLLQTSRMDRAWYLLGAACQTIAALGLHRKKARNRTSNAAKFDYISLQCQRRTFWVAYTIDVYLSVVFGRPRYFHDHDIDQELPASINDEDMGPQGPISVDEGFDCDSNMDAVIAHVELAKVIGDISREVYSIKPIPKQERLAPAQRSAQDLHTWRAKLPPHLGSVRPSSLIPSLRRQAMALKLAYCHAIIHANRPFLLGEDGETHALKDSVAECISSARTALKTVEAMTSDDSLFHALWWTPYVTFCALAVVYVWEIQQNSAGNENSEEDQKMFALAEKCHSLLARATSTDSPSRRYTVILEELRREARVQLAKNTPPSMVTTPFIYSAERGLNVPTTHNDPTVQPAYSYSFESHMPQSLNDWQATDWLDLDSSAFGLFQDLDGGFTNFVVDGQQAM